MNFLHEVYKKLNKELKLTITILKLVISIFLVYYLINNVNFKDAFIQIQKLSVITILFILSIFLSQLILSSTRYHGILSIMGIHVSFLTTIRSIFIGYFFSQTMISFIGGDAMRIFSTANSDEKISQITKAVIVDRLSGFVGQILILTLTLPFLIPVLPRMGLKIFLLLIVLTSFGLVFMVFWLGRKVSSSSRKTITSILTNFSKRILDRLYTREALFYFIGLSFLIGLINCLAYFFIAKALEIPLTFEHVLILTPPAFFLSMLPISISGWGVREGATVMMLAIVGISSSDALCISIIFGLSLLAISLPGGFIWLISPKRIKNIRVSKPTLPE